MGGNYFYGLDYGTACSSSGWSNCTSTASSSTTWGVSDIKAAMNQWIKITSDDYTYKSSKVALSAGQSYELPDGSKLVIDTLGNHRIEDKDAKVTYKANRVREFSPHLNASDMVAKFIEYCGGLGVRRGELMDLPLNLFIQWLIIEAAQRDDDPLPPEVVPIAQHPRLLAVLKPKCLTCGRFIKRLHMEARFPFCSPAHGAIYVERRRPLLIAQEAVPALAN